MCACDKLAVVGCPLTLSEQNIYIFKGLQRDFKDIVTTLSALPKPVTFSELHSLLLNHEFIHGQTLLPLYITSSSSSDLTPNAATNFSQQSSPPHHTSNNSCGRGRNYGRDKGGNRGEDPIPIEAAQLQGTNGLPMIPAKGVRFAMVLIILPQRVSKGMIISPILQHICHIKLQHFSIHNGIPPLGLLITLLPILLAYNKCVKNDSCA